jgi:hypothetical protein
LFVARAFVQSVVFGLILQEGAVGENFLALYATVLAVTALLLVFSTAEVRTCWECEL